MHSEGASLLLVGLSAVKSLLSICRPGFIYIGPGEATVAHWACVFKAHSGELITSPFNRIIKGDFYGWFQYWVMSNQLTSQRRLCWNTHGVLTALCGGDVAQNTLELAEKCGGLRVCVRACVCVCVSQCKSSYQILFTFHCGIATCEWRRNISTCASHCDWKNKQGTTELYFKKKKGAGDVMWRRIRDRYGWSRLGPWTD